MKKILSKDGTPLAFDQSGAGPAVILVGGAFQHRAIDSGTAQLAAKLSPHFTVLHYDRRGRGDSGNTLPYAIEREVEDIDALLQAVGGSASVFGMSSGAVLALRAAAAGLAIKKLAVYEAATFLILKRVQDTRERSVVPASLPTAMARGPLDQPPRFGLPLAPQAL